MDRLYKQNIRSVDTKISSNRKQDLRLTNLKAGKAIKLSGFVGNDILLELDRQCTYLYKFILKLVLFYFTYFILFY